MHRQFLEARAYRLSWARASFRGGTDRKANVAVISSGYWPRRFASIPIVCGKGSLSRTFRAIIGVTPPEVLACRSVQ